MTYSSPTHSSAELRPDGRAARVVPALSSFDEQAVLRGLIFTGTALAQRIGEQALQQREMAEGGLPAAMAFEKTARTVRRCMMLARKLAEDAAAAARPVVGGVEARGVETRGAEMRGAQAGPADKPEVERPEVERPEARDADEGADAPEAAEARAEAGERGDAEGEDDARADDAAVARLARRPVGEAAAEMEQALGEAAALVGVGLPVAGDVSAGDAPGRGGARDARGPGITQRGTAQRGTAQRGAAQRGVAQRGTAQGGAGRGAGVAAAARGPEPPD